LQLRPVPVWIRGGFISVFFDAPLNFSVGHSKDSLHGFLEGREPFQSFNHHLDGSVAPLS
jgi:hypothetical protein